MKRSNLRHCRPAHRTKDWANTRGELASCGPAHPLPEAESQSDNSQSQWGAISAPEIPSSTKLRAGSQLLTKSSWDPRWLTSARRVAARGQLPRGDTQHTWDSVPTAHPGNWVVGPGRWEDLPPSWENVLTKHLLTWAAWTWVGHQTKAQPSLCLCGIPENLNLSSLDWTVHATQGLL